MASATARSITANQRRRAPVSLKLSVGFICGFQYHHSRFLKCFRRKAEEKCFLWRSYPAVTRTISTGRLFGAALRETVRLWASVAKNPFAVTLQPEES